MEPRVTLEQGTYTGRHHPPTPERPSGLDIFQGIPYALPTGGEHRFRPARPIGSGNGEFDAGALGHISPYTDAASEPFASGEDCLSLNICIPSHVGEGDGGERQRGKLPVVVYLHGGAFNMGHGVDRDMASFVAHAGDVIAVGVNYRLGVLGFLPSSSVVGEAGREGLNLGLGDQRVAMGWVGRNIGAFGGDGGRVGIMGISAGAHSIGHHLLNEPPFTRAILESGAATARAVLSPQHPRHEAHFTQLLTALDIPPADPSPLSKLRSIPLERLTRAAKEVWDSNAQSVTWPFQPVIDGPGGTIPAAPLALLEAGKGRGVPLILGFCTNEGSAFVPPLHTPSGFYSFFQTLIPGLTAADLEALDALYPPSEFAPEPPVKGLGAHWRRGEAAYAHYAYIAPVLQTAAYLAPHAPVYVYEFAVRDAVLGMANHTDQTPFVTRSELEYDGLREVGERMHGFFAEFLTGGKMEGWPRFGGPGDGEGEVMVFGRGNEELLGGGRGVAAEVRRVGERERERVRFWWERSGLSQGMGDRLDV